MKQGVEPANHQSSLMARRRLHAFVWPHRPSQPSTVPSRVASLNLDGRCFVPSKWTSARPASAFIQRGKNVHKTVVKAPIRGELRSLEGIPPDDADDVSQNNKKVQ